MEKINDYDQDNNKKISLEEYIENTYEINKTDIDNYEHKLTKQVMDVNYLN